MSDKVKTSMKLDAKLWEEAKIQAIKRKIDLQDLVEQALKKELKFADA